ncbi:MAG: hypothetical protein WCD18_15750 [Thermosynechococcaceae cyanobacterium]
MNDHLEIYGYHGTTTAKAMNILTQGFRASDNDYDWLGTGIYFFQDAPLRAEQWATQQYPENPAVIRALIRLDNCIDLFDIGWQPGLKNLYNSFVEQYRGTNRPLPTQNPDRSKAHRLDCAFFNYSIEFISLAGQTVDSVRAAFMEGDRLFPNSAIFDLAHVQIAIRNPALILETDIIKF